MSDWKPEVGQVCDVYVDMENQKGHVRNVTIKYLGKRMAVFEEGGNEYAHHFDEIIFKPIQTEDDKYRDEQIEKINNQLAIYGFERVYSETGEHLYKQGVRVIAPDEYVVKALTDEQIDSIVNNNSHATSSGWRVDGEAIARAVQRELGIEV